MDFRIHSRLTLGAGTLFILVGIFLPSSAVIESLRTAPDLEVTEHLSLGITLFKIGFVILGLVCIVLGQMPLWHLESKREKAIPDPYQRLSFLILAALFQESFWRTMDSGVISALKVLNGPSSFPGTVPRVRQSSFSGK